MVASDVAVLPQDHLEQVRFLVAPIPWVLFRCADSRKRGLEGIVAASVNVTGSPSLLSKPGGPIRILDQKAAPSIMEDIGLFYGHGARTFVGVVHNDCHYMRGLFGPLTEEEERYKFQEMGLHVAPILHRDFPNLNVLLWYLRLDPKTGVPLSFEPLFRGMNLAA